MDPQPPAPPPPPGVPSGQRPGLVTAAGVLEIILGALGILIGILFVTAGSLFVSAVSSAQGVDTGAATGLGGIFIVVAIVVALVGILEIYAGIQILKLRERGRMIGLVLAIISLVMNLLSIGRSSSSSIVSILISGFIIYALITTKEHFSAEGR